jgi:hypothetical protein
MCKLVPDYLALVPYACSRMPVGASCRGCRVVDEARPIRASMTPYRRSNAALDYARPGPSTEDVNGRAMGRRGTRQNL